MNTPIPKPPQTAPTGGKNVFNTPIVGSKALIKRRIQFIRLRNLHKAYFYLGLALAVLIPYSVGFFYPQLTAYLDAPAKIAVLEQQIQTNDVEIIPNIEKELKLHKSAYDEEIMQVEDALEKVLPGKIDKLGIVKRLEDFATVIDATDPPFELNSIRFGSPVEQNGYTVLPISTSIKSNAINFNRFLKLVDRSGRVDEENIIRLMSIDNINIRYKDPDLTARDNEVNFSVKLYAYSR